MAGWLAEVSNNDRSMFLIGPLLFILEVVVVVDNKVVAEGMLLLFF